MLMNKILNLPNIVSFLALKYPFQIFQASSYCSRLSVGLLSYDSRLGTARNFSALSPAGTFSSLDALQSMSSVKKSSKNQSGKYFYTHDIVWEAQSLA